MKRKFFLFLMLCAFNAEATESKYVEYETGACFVFIQEDVKHNVFSIISDSESSVKHDGSYCYIDDETSKKYNTESSLELKIPAKYCKDLPPYKYITKKLNPVKTKKIVIPNDDTNIKPFSIPNDLSEDITYFLDYYGSITNKTKDYNLSFSFNGNQIDLELSGKGRFSRGMCGGVVTNIISLKINNIQIFSNLHTEGCSGTISINKIDLDFKNGIVILHTYKSANEDEKLKLHIPFKYFKDSGSIRAFTKNAIEKIIKYQGKKI